ncbi:iron-siderophore ABC transporter substrate-binding protein [Aeromicrobium fastidiosum]|uniref:Iron-siderophore ABC transporter substrate-binding protein n=1 Tax=Aeromicrobium fastidiosum TaxID=52699 RepID=A0A641AQT3_9ACTN|nr:iron-siderophore ABC transporter substrate-binding protein [Aeromicrobium fastidiosum]
MAVTKRLTWRAGVAAVAAMIALTGCGGASDDETETTTKTSDGAFPVTVDHEFGSTTVKAEPKRIVVAGLTEQDTVLQLGFTPIATTEWYGEQPYAVWPWAQGMLGDAKPTVLKQTDGPEYEKIASLRPDLIIAVNAGLDKQMYDKLAKIAPTVAQPKGGTQYFSPWDEQAIQTAKALGKEKEGRQLVADTKAAYAKVAAEHPEFKGKTATFSQGLSYDGLLYVYQDGLSTEFLTYLGFTITPGLEKYSEGPGIQAAIPEEKLDVIDADVIVFATEEAKNLDNLKAMPTFDTLKAVQQNRAVYTEGTVAGALYFITPASLMYALDKLTPQLERAVKGESPQKVG